MIPTERVPITDNYRIFFAHTSNQSWCAMDRVEEYNKNGESNSGNLQEFESAPISMKIHSGENESRFEMKGGEKFDQRFRRFFDRASFGDK